MAFLDVQSSSTPQSLPLLLCSPWEGGGLGAGDPSAPAAVPAPARPPARFLARTPGARSPPLTLISRHITCCSCESPGDVLLSGARGRGGRGTRPSPRRPRPDLSGRPRLPSRDGWRWRPHPSPHRSPKFAVLPPEAPGAPGAGPPTGKGLGGRRWALSPSARGHHLRPPSPSPAAPRCPRLSITLQHGLFHCFNGGDGEMAMPERGAWEGSGACKAELSGGSPARRRPPRAGRGAPPAPGGPRGPRAASRWGELGWAGDQRRLHPAPSSTPATPAQVRAPRPGRAAAALRLQRRSAPRRLSPSLPHAHS